MSRTLKAIWRTAALGVCVAAAISSRLAGQAGAWYSPLPTGPFSGGAGSIFASAPDNPVAGFTGPEGAGVSPYLGLDTDQFVNPSFAGWATQVAAYAPANLIDGFVFRDPEQTACVDFFGRYDFHFSVVSGFSGAATARIAPSNGY